MHETLLEIPELYDRGNRDNEAVGRRGAGMTAPLHSKDLQIYLAFRLTEPKMVIEQFGLLETVKAFWRIDSHSTRPLGPDYNLFRFPHVCPGCDQACRHYRACCSITAKQMKRHLALRGV
jgi:hypothetical protein